MKDPDIEYDAFLSYASEDVEWCEALAERLRDEGVRVWFDRWEIEPGDHLLMRLNEGLEKSRKMLAVWSKSYFRDDKVWTMAESFSMQYQDVLAQDRPLIPLLIEDCPIKPTFQNIIHIDFRNRHDFDLRIRQLLDALDLPRREFSRAFSQDFAREFAEEEEYELREYKVGMAARGRANYAKGKRFEEEVAALYRLLGFDVKQDVKVSGVQIDLLIEQKVGGLLTQAIVECKEKRVTADERNQILAQQNIAQKKLPAFRWIAVSSQGFAADTRTALDDAGVSCITYPELIREMVPLDDYVEDLISEYESWVEENWRGEDWFIRPNLLTDIVYKERSALGHIAKWLGAPTDNLLTVLGDLGTGKSTLARFLAFNIARGFKEDPLRHPAPVLIPLKEVRKALTLESIIVSHFAARGIRDVSFSRFIHLVRAGKIVLLFDAFDEMADRVRWEVTRSNFHELRRAAEGNGKVLLTCRTHYFKDRNEQARLIGQGPSLSEIETELYKELRQQPSAEVVYLQEFDDQQIRAYLGRARPASAEEDWKKIRRIYNLKDLAHRPLLLDMIVKSLPRLEEGQTINAANLYNVYTGFWIEREEGKGRFLDKETKLGLMLELAWCLWDSEESALHYKELVPFVERLVEDKIMEFGDEEAGDVAREMQVATFLKRDDAGQFSFIHRSFMEYFLAHKLLQGIISEEGEVDLRSVMETRRIDRKVIYFLTLLDEGDRIREPLRRILTSPYSPKVSENALQILYWSGRIRGGMEETVPDMTELKALMKERIPGGANLGKARLQEILLEGVSLPGADLTAADLTKANLNDAVLRGSDLQGAVLVEARCLRADLSECHLRRANLLQTNFNESDLSRADLRDANTKFSEFVNADLEGARTDMEEFEPRASRIGRGAEGLKAVVRTGHGLAVNTVAYSPDGAMLAAGGADGIISIWRTRDGKLLTIMEGHTQGVMSVTFSPDGEKVASGSSDKSVRLWDVKTGKTIQTLEGHTQGVRSVTFSPDGEKVASGSDDQSVRLWDVKTGKTIQTLEGHTNWVMSVNFSPDGEKVASGSDDQSVRLWEVKTGKTIQILEGHTSLVMSVNFSPDGEKVASGSSDKSVRLWDVKSGKSIQTLEGHTSLVMSVNFSPDGEKVASGSSDKSVRLWDVKSGKSIQTLEGHTDLVMSVNFSPDGEKVASGSDDHSVRLWDVKTGKSIQTLEGHTHYVSSVNFSPNGEKMASGSYDKSVRLWEVKSGKSIQTLEGHTDWVRSVNFSPDGEKVASGSDDHSVRLWDVKTGKSIQILEGHTHYVSSVNFSPDGAKMASGSYDQNVRLWEVKSGKSIQTLEGHTSLVMSVDFSPDGEKVASGSYDHSVRLWDVKSGKSIQTLEGHTKGVMSVNFSPDGEKVASGSYDQSVRLWEVKTGECLCVMEGHLGPVEDARFAPNGRYLVAAGTAGRLQFWDFEKCETFLYRYGFGPGAWLDLLPDGRFDASPEGMRYLYYTEMGTLNSYRAEDLVKEFYDPDAVAEMLARYVD